MRSVLLISGDLMLASQLQGPARAAGFSLEQAPAAVAVEEAAGAELVIADLAAPGLDIAALAEQLQQLDPPPRLVAFGPHVQEARLQAAAAAGCDAVLTRGQLFRTAAEMFRGGKQK